MPGHPGRDLKGNVALAFQMIDLHHSLAVSEIRHITNTNQLPFFIRDDAVGYVFRSLNMGRLAPQYEINLFFLFGFIFRYFSRPSIRTSM